MKSMSGKMITLKGLGDAATLLIAIMIWVYSLLMTAFLAYHTWVWLF